jgi:flagellin
MRINQNVMANNASRNLSSTNVMLGKNLEKLSSGFRINRAADDAAGLVISQGLRAQVSGLKQATRNAQDGISVVQTAEGALNEVHSMLTRMRDLSVQAANSGGNDAAARAAAQSEIDALATEITRVSDSTRFGGVNLLDGSYGIKTTVAGGTGGVANTGTVAASGGSFSIQVNGGSTVAVTLSANLNSSQSSADTLESDINAALKTAGSIYAGKVSVTTAAISGSTTLNKLTIQVDGLKSGQTFALTDGAGSDLSDLGITTLTSGQTGTGGTFQIGANSGESVTLGIKDLDATALGVGALNVTTDTGAASAITALDSAISTVSSTRGDLGALQNRFESMINNLQVTTENLSASESRIRDTDMAQEMVSFTKNNVLLQAGTAMLSQANQVPQSILSLLR